jgi:hypothetical protein
LYATFCAGRVSAQEGDAGHERLLHHQHRRESLLLDWEARHEGGEEERNALRSGAIMRENVFFSDFGLLLLGWLAMKHGGVAKTGSGQNSFKTIVLPRQSVAAKQVPSSET